MGEATRRLGPAELMAFRGARVDDLLGERPRLLFVGINPGLWTAAVGAHFARPGNRFWPALHQAGITAEQIDARSGLHPTDRDALLEAGVGITNLVPVATARADEVTSAELHAGAIRLRELVGRVQPNVVAVLGLTAYRQAFSAPRSVAGRQQQGIGEAQLWVLPNPSGLNAHETAASLAVAYRAAAEAAGLRLVR